MVHKTLSGSHTVTVTHQPPTSLTQVKLRHQLRFCYMSHTHTCYKSIHIRLLNQVLFVGKICHREGKPAFRTQAYPSSPNRHRWFFQGRNTEHSLEVGQRFSIGIYSATTKTVVIHTICISYMYYVSKGHTLYPKHTIHHMYYSLASSPTQNPVLQHQKIHFGAKGQQKAPPERRTGTQIRTG